MGALKQFSHISSNIQKLQSNIYTRGIDEAMMKLGQQIEYEQLPKIKEQRGRRPMRHCYSPMNHTTRHQPQFDLERSCGGNTGKTESGGSVPRTNILDDMEDDEFKVEGEVKQINDELTADLAGAKT